jgi:hypothetical protein
LKQRKTQAAAEEKIAEATSRMTAMAGDISNKASGQWDKLENIFEDRVAKALNKLGVPSAKDVSALSARIDELTKTIHQISGPASGASKKTASKKAAKPIGKTAAKRASPRKTDFQRQVKHAVFKQGALASFFCAARSSRFNSSLLRCSIKLPPCALHFEPW